MGFDTFDVKKKPAASRIRNQNKSIINIRKNLPFFKSNYDTYVTVPFIKAEFALKCV